MKLKLLLMTLLIILISISCINQKDLYKKERILYLLPKEVNDTLKKEIIERHYEKICFKLVTIIDLKKYAIHLIEFDDEFTLSWIKNTNRFIELDNFYFPLIFENDNTFATVESIEELERNKINDSIFSYTQTYFGVENEYKIVFTLKGKILYHGYGSPNEETE